MPQLCSCIGTEGPENPPELIDVKQSFRIKNVRLNKEV